MRLGLPRRRTLPLVASFCITAACRPAEPPARPSPSTASRPDGPGAGASGATAASSPTTSRASGGELEMFPSLGPDGTLLAYTTDRTGSFEIHVKSRSGGETQVTRDGHQNFEPAFSPDGTSIAYHCKTEGGLFLAPLDGGAHRRLTTFGSRPAWSPDGTEIAFQSDPLTDLGATAAAAMPPSTIWVVPVSGGAPVAVTRAGDPPGGHGSPAFSPDGTRVFFGAYDRRSSSIWSIGRNGEGLVTVASEPPLAFDPVVHPDGRSVYYCGSETLTYGSLWRQPIDPSTGAAAGKPVKAADIGFGALKHLAIARDGSRLAFGVYSITSNLTIQPLKKGTLEPDGPPHTPLPAQGRQTRPAFSPDGRRIAFNLSFPTRPAAVWVMNRDGTDAVQLTDDPSVSTLPSWLPNGRAVAFLSSRTKHPTLWAVEVDGKAPPRKEWQLADLGDDAESPRLTADGKRVAFHSRRNGNTINVWVADVPGGSPRQLTFDKELMGFPCWSPDGKWIAVEKKRGSYTNIHVVPASGGPSIALTDDAGQSWPHDWMPDGDHVLFAGFRDGMWNIWAVSRTTRKAVPITRNRRLTAYMRYPAPSPGGDAVAYEYAETNGQIRSLELASPQNAGR